MFLVCCVEEIFSYFDIIIIIIIIIYCGKGVRKNRGVLQGFKEE